MKIRIRNTLEFIKYSESELELDLNKPFLEIIAILNETFKPKSNNIRYVIVRSTGQVEIKDFTKSLNDYNFKENDALQLENIAITIPAYLVTVISYSGPPLIFSLFYLNSKSVGCVQIMAILMILFHFLRRIYESTFIFQMGVERFPLLSGDLFGVTFYYWAIYGIYGGYAIFNTRYEDSSTFYVIKTFVFIILFLYAEYGNNRAHVYLANLKKNNNNQRAIPRGGMFEYVSCAHYFWEVMSWVFFACIVNTLPSYINIVTSLLSMGFLALKRHKSMQTYFGEKYPQNRKAFIPYLF